MKPQALIKVRRNENTANKLATLRQLSNDGQRDRSSLGVVALIDNLDEEDEMTDTSEEAPVGTNFQRVMQMRNQLNMKNNKRMTEKGASRNSPLLKVASEQS